MKLGARTFKTGLAVVLAIYLAGLTGFSPVTFSAVAACLTIMPTIYRSYKHMIEQVKANLVGAMLAVIVLMIVDSSEPWIVGIVVILAITINIKLGFKKSLMVSVLTVVAILEAPTGNNFVFAFQRFTLIMIGIFSSVFINMLFFPPKYEKRLREVLKKSNDNIALFLKLIMIGDFEEKIYKEELEKVRKNVSESKDVYELYKEEYNNLIRKTKYKEARKLVVLRKFTMNLTRFYLLIETIDNHYFTKKEEMPINIMEAIHGHLHLLLEYKEKIILKFDKKVRSSKTHSKDPEVYGSSKHLISVFLEHYSVDEMEEWNHIFPLVSALIEITEELNYLDQLVDSLNSHHNEEDIDGIQSKKHSAS